MDFSQLARSRRTVHNYTSAGVERAVVEEALRLSLWAPNHKLTFPWVYVMAGPKARRELADLQVDLKRGKDPDISPTKAEAVRQTILNPAYLIALGVRKGEAKRQHEDYATLACSVQIASLYLWEKGIASKWTSSGFMTHERTYKILGLKPEEVQLEGGLFIGHAQLVPEATERPPLEKFLKVTD